MLKNYIKLLIILILPFQPLVAQTDGFLFNYMGMGAATALATDYQSIGINPANLGYTTDYNIAIEITGIGTSIYSPSLAAPDLRQFMFNSGEGLTDEEQVQLANDILTDGIRVSARVTPLAMSFSIGNAGKIAVSAFLRSDQSFQMGASASSLLFEGYDFENYFDTIITDIEGNTFGVANEPLSLAELTDGTTLDFSLQTAFNIAWGRQWLETELMNLYVGVGARYVLSYAELSYASQGGNVAGNAALGLDILNTPDYINTFDPDQEFLTPVGKGFGFDIGVSADFGERITAALSVVDIGNVDYTLNALAFADVIIDTLEFNGIESTEPFDVLSAILKDEEIIAYDGVENFSRPLPTSLRMGAAFRATEYLTVAADFNVPISSSAQAFKEPQLGLGAKLTLARFIDISTGVTAGGGYGVNVPASFVLNFPFWELGVATRDISIFWNENQPTISYAIGLLRFKI